MSHIVNNLRTVIFELLRNALLVRSPCQVASLPMQDLSPSIIRVTLHPRPQRSLPSQLFLKSPREVPWSTRLVFVEETNHPRYPGNDGSEASNLQ